jgi:hypothetical protein
MDWEINRSKNKKGKGKGHRNDVKKRDKAWKSKNKPSNHNSSHEIDDDILYMMNQTRCRECRVVYSLSLDACPYCIKRA